MVHPTELLRTTSSGDESRFVAPVGDYRNDVDCGCNALPCLSEKLNLEKFAKPGYFVTALSLTGLFTGIAVKYFRGTSQIWSKHYNISQDSVDWFIYINEIFVGVFALFVAYWGHRMHRPNWLGALTIYFGVSCITLIIPELYQPFTIGETDVNTVNGRVLCQVSRSSELAYLSTDFNNQVVAIALIILYQIVFALHTISFVTHGVTYIDDNTPPSRSPALIALIFAAQRMGKQSGIYSAWMPFLVPAQSIFISAVWLVVGVLIFLVGCIIAMFPKIMPNILLRKSVNSLLNIASGNAVIESKQSVDGFFKSLRRILKNKILLLSITSMTFMQAAIINFSIKEKYFNQSKYHVSKYNDVSGYSDPSLIQFSTNLLKQPLIGLSYISAGMVIAKMKPKAKYLVLWNIKVFVTVLLTFAGIRFFSCTTKLRNEIDGKLTLPYCSWNCGCSLDGPFQPICLNGQTHFSPCWGGCSSFESSLRIYRNCSCGTESVTEAAEASCDADNCNTLWALAQASGVITAALLGTTFITTIVIILRSVASKDKALALGLYMTCASLVPYLPVRAVYDVITDNFCQMWGKKTCQFYSEEFALFVGIFTICLKIIAILFSILLLFYIKKLELYTNNQSRRHSDDLAVLRRPGVINNNNVYHEEPTASTANDIEEQQSENEQAAALIHNPSNLIRNKQNSDSQLDSTDRSSKDDRINAYLSEGDLVPPLKTNLKLGKSASRNSNSNKSVLSDNDSSLSAIANAVGDDHDSDFSSLQRPQKLYNEQQSSPKGKIRKPPPPPQKFNVPIEETEF